MLKKTHTMIKALVLVPALLLLFACNPLENQTDSNTILIIENLTGTDIAGNTANFLESDVVKVDLDTGAETIFADAATATLRARLLDPQPINPASEYNSIQITRYTVTYNRSDGKNTEGLDIPYAFEGFLSTRLDVDATVDISFIIVRAVAKAEPPLLNLKDGRSEGVITITARIDIYGKDLREKTVKATGYLTIYFANYADE